MSQKTISGVNECGEPAFTPEPASYRAGSMPTIDGPEFYLAAETLWPEIWPAAHNRELWGAGPDGTYNERWKNDGTGYSYDD